MFNKGKESKLCNQFKHYNLYKHSRRKKNNRNQNLRNALYSDIYLK